MAAEGEYQQVTTQLPPKTSQLSQVNKISDCKFKTPGSKLVLLFSTFVLQQLYKEAKEIFRGEMDDQSSSNPT